MVWTAPSIKIFNLNSPAPPLQQAAPASELHTFEATGTGFDESQSQLLFVRADAEGGKLRPYQVIPCTDLKVDEAAGGTQRIVFKASLYQREEGAYHLIGWNPTHQGQNESCVLEWAMAVRTGADVTHAPL